MGERRGDVLVGRSHAGPFGEVGVAEEDGAGFAELGDDEGVLADHRADENLWV